MRMFLLSISLLISSTLFAQECELYYSFDSHPHGWKVLGETIMRHKSHVALNDWRPFMAAEDARLDGILNAVTAINSKLKIAKGMIIQGGYKGKTQLSVRRTVHTESTATEKDVLALAAIIAYIYVQDSVLVVCAADKTSAASIKAEKYELVDQGKQTYLSPDTAQTLYREVITRLSNVESMGYSYDQHRKTYMVLEFAGKQDIKNTLNAIADELASSSQGQIHLHLNSTTTEVYFPANDWREYSQGQAYLTLIADAADTSWLEKQQLRFIHHLTDFLLTQ